MSAGAIIANVGIVVGRKARLLRRRVVAVEDHAGANLVGANLSGLDLRGKVFRNARLHGADLMACNLIGADLEGADLSDAWLTDAQLSGANLRAANLTRAYLCGANFDGAEINETVLDGVVRDHATTWPIRVGSSEPPDAQIDEPVLDKSARDAATIWPTDDVPSVPRRPPDISPIAPVSTTEPPRERRLVSGTPVGLVGRIVEGRREGFFIEVYDDNQRPGGRGGWYVRYWNGDAADHDWFLNDRDIPATFADIRVEWFREKESTAIPRRHGHDSH